MKGKQDEKGHSLWDLKRAKKAGANVWGIWLFTAIQGTQCLHSRGSHAPQVCCRTWFCRAKKRAVEKAPDLKPGVPSSQAASGSYRWKHVCSQFTSPGFLILNENVREQEITYHVSIKPDGILEERGISKGGSGKEEKKEHRRVQRTLLRLPLAVLLLSQLFFRP